MWFWLFWISFALLGFGVFYVRWLLKTLTTINTDVKNATDMVQDFVNHVDTIHDMEIFYGDETLAGLIRHGKDLVATLRDIDFLLDEGESEEEIEQIDEKT